VLRDARVVGEVAMASATKTELARMMVDREVALRIEHQRREPGLPVLEARNVSLVETNGRRRLSNIDLTVREHEILGIAGVDGNGQRELVEVLTGMREPTEGRIALAGSTFERLTPQEFHRASGAVIPEDRHHTGTALTMSVAENLLLRDFAARPYARRGFFDNTQIRRHAQQLVTEYAIRCPGIDATMSVLSGGNQQRTVLARELHSKPRVLIAAQPTRGLDVGAIEMVYRRMLEYRDAGGGILLISIELDEILSLADRIAVMVRGRLVRTVDVADADAELLGLLMAGEPAHADEGLVV
jgi:simple sugar transport system ATP-binding protein